MKILTFSQGHDIGSAYLEDENLVFAHEAEKDSGPRHSALITPELLLNSFRIDNPPDVLAYAGWHKPDNFHSTTDAGYFGIGQSSQVTFCEKILGRTINIYSSSHERSHIMCSYGLSDLPQGQPCYALVWEGSIGGFYHIDSNLVITKIGDVMEEPGNKYGFLYALADPTMPEYSLGIRLSDAGKLMALAGYGVNAKPDTDELQIMTSIDKIRSFFGFPHKALFKGNKYFNIGLESQEFKNLALKFSEYIFGRFYSFACNHLKQKLPLIISGGCGLNCEWNSRWKNSNLFSDVFVPPCTNDSGVALGAAIDAQFYYTGIAKIKWDVYSGDNFREDIEIADLNGFEKRQLDMQELCTFLNEGKVFGWVQGRTEMGPRALGNRSLIAAPFTAEIRDKLNKIKQRENFRPIAPICLEEELDKCFIHNGPSPHMLYFQKVKSPKLAAITHVDGSARIQTVTRTQNQEIYDLLCEFKRLTGFGVLCNTSLNFKGYGFINRLSDLAEFSRTRSIDGFVIGNFIYLNHLLQK